MHKTVLKLFGFLKSCVQFFKIITVFCIMMLLLYWTNNLANYNWKWLGFISPVLDYFVNIGSIVSQGSIKLFHANFEYKYFIALSIFLTFYYIEHLIYICLVFTEELYNKSRALVKKMEENLFNKSLQEKNTLQQKKIRYYQVYINVFIKDKFNNKFQSIDLEEEKNKLNKFLIEKTQVAPIKFEKGFLYAFSTFDNIDNTLDILSRILKTDSPLDYLIGIQIIDNDRIKCNEQLKRLIKLNILNKITTLSETVYRYSFNKNQQYETIQLGLFQKEKDTFEVHEFIKYN